MLRWPFSSIQPVSTLKTEETNGAKNSGLIFLGSGMLLSRRFQCEIIGYEREKDKGAIVRMDKSGETFRCFTLPAEFFFKGIV
jgi:hypothetical protein